MAAYAALTTKVVELSDDITTASDDDDYGNAQGSTIENNANGGVGSKRRREATAENVGDIPVKVEWTDDSDGDYERLKKRKRGTGSRGRSRGRVGSKGRKDKTAANDTARGGTNKTRGQRTARGRSRRPSGRLAAINDDSNGAACDPPKSESEEDDDIPDYLKQRRREFEDKRTILCDAGLRLPPDYSDVYFSDDERSSSITGRLRSPLLERPQFDSSVRPSRDKRDIALQYSAGTIPSAIAQYLRDYQVTGVQFLHRLFVYQRGGILGDDMGLGKTVQVAAFLAAAFGKTGDERDAKRMRKMRRAAAESQEKGDGDGKRWYPVVLIVCPGSLIQNWRNELQRWGWWHVDLYHGAGKDDVLQSARAGRLEIMVTTYTTYKNHRDRINRVQWDAVVADECHLLKERVSGTTRAMNEVNALCRIGLTGTAIQNRYDELWTLLNWTNPGRFGTIAEWRQTITRPLTIGQSHDATLYQLSLARRTAKKLVQNLLPDFFLRRLKSLIAEQLPSKTDRVVFCPLTERQTEAYHNFVNSEQVTMLRTVSEPCNCGSGNARGWCCYRTLSDGKTTWFSLVFPTIQNLLKLANHLTLLVPTADSSAIGLEKDSNDSTADTDELEPNALAGGRLAVDRFKRALKVLKTCVPSDWETLYRHRDSMVNLANPEFCGKWKVLRKLLRFWHENGDKVLVFSHNVRLLRILQHLFHNTSYSVSYLDGSLSYEERQRVVDDFNADPAQFVFLISTKAGGVGLNITSANKVVIFDPHWNPAYDLQAQDRAYRIGQVRDVDVFRLVSAGTIEEIVYARQIYKQQQANIGYSASTERRYFRGVQEDSERKGEIFGLNNLLAFHTDQVVLRDIVNKTNIAEAKAGVRMTDIDMERAADDDETKVLDKIEGLEKDTKPPAVAAASNKSKSDAVQAILASAGVEYTHDNSEVVGSSRVEAQLSRRAEMVLGDEAEDALLDQQAKDNGNGNGDGHEHNQDTSAADLSMLLADTSAAFISAGDTDNPYAFTDYLLANHRLRYNPPPDVMRRQFCTMAREAGFVTATDFAMVVENWTPEQRRQCLEGFYRKRMVRVREMEEAAAETEGSDEGDEEDDVSDEERGAKVGAKEEAGAVKEETDDGNKNNAIQPAFKTETEQAQQAQPRPVKKEVDEKPVWRWVKEEDENLGAIDLSSIKQCSPPLKTEPRIKREEFLPATDHSPRIEGEKDVSTESKTNKVKQEKEDEGTVIPPRRIVGDSEDDFNETPSGRDVCILTSSPIAAAEADAGTPRYNNVCDVADAADDDDDDETDEL